MTSTPADLYQQAQGFIREGNYKEAEKRYRMLIALHPDIPQAHFELASLLNEMGANPALIVNHYEMFIQLAEENPELSQQVTQARQKIFQVLNPSPIEYVLAQTELEERTLDLPDDRILVDKMGNGHFTRLGDAIANNPHDLPIHIKPGRYNETIMITNSDLDLAISGPSSGERAIVMSSKDHCLYIDCRRLKISNLAFSNGSPKAAVEVVGGQVSLEGCVFQDCNTAGINIRYAARLDLNDGNIFFGGGTALQVADQAVLEVGSGGPNFFFSNLRGSIIARGESKLSIKNAGFNYHSDLVSEEIRGSLPYYGLGEFPVIRLQDSASAVISDCKITGWGTLIHVEDQATVRLSGLESNTIDGFSKQACTPEVFLWVGKKAKAIIEHSAFSSGVVGASGIVCSGQADVKINKLTLGGEITMLKVEGGTLDAAGVDHQDNEGRNVVGLRAEGGSFAITESYLPLVIISDDLNASFEGVRFGGRDNLGNSFRGDLRFDHCEFSGDSRFDGQIVLLHCTSGKLYSTSAWMSFYSGRVRIKGGKYRNHVFVVACAFEIAEAVFQFDTGYASPNGVIDFKSAAIGKLERCSIASPLPKNQPALRIHREADVRQVQNTLHGKVKMYR